MSLAYVATYKQRHLKYASQPGVGIRELIGYAILAQKLIKWIKANPKTINTISASVLVIIAGIIVVTQQY